MSYSLFTGYVVARKRSPEKTDFCYPTLTLRDFSEQEVLMRDQLKTHSAYPEAMDERFLSRRGDVIVRLCAPFGARLIGEACSEGILISSAFAIVRPQAADYLPEFLAWKLNTPRVQIAFRQERCGVAARPIGRKAIEAAIGRLPSLDVQRRVMRLWTLAQKEQHLYQQLAALRLELAHVAIDKLLEEDDEERF